MAKISWFLGFYQNLWHRRPGIRNHVRLTKKKHKKIGIIGRIRWQWMGKGIDRCGMCPRPQVIPTLKKYLPTEGDLNRSLSCTVECSTSLSWRNCLNCLLPWWKTNVATKNQEQQQQQQQFQQEEEEEDSKGFSKKTQDLYFFPT